MHGVNSNIHTRSSYLKWQLEAVLGLVYKCRTHVLKLLVIHGVIPFKRKAVGVVVAAVETFELLLHNLC